MHAILKPRHLGYCAFCHRLVVPEQALGGIPLDFGIVVEDKASELSYTTVCVTIDFSCVRTLHAHAQVIQKYYGLKQIIYTSSLL